MNTPITALGAGTTVLGLGLNAAGTAQGLQSMAKVRKRQFQQQRGFQRQLNDSAQRNISGVNVAGGINQATTDLNGAATEQAAQLLAHQPNGGNYAASLPSNALESLVHRGIGDAPGLYDARFNSHVRDSQNEQNTISDAADSAAIGYDSALRRAGDKGQGLRLVGSVLGAAGPGIANYGIWDGVATPQQAGGTPNATTSYISEESAPAMGYDYPFNPLLSERGVEVPFEDALTPTYMPVPLSEDMPGFMIPQGAGILRSLNKQAAFGNKLRVVNPSTITR